MIISHSRTVYICHSSYRGVGGGTLSVAAHRSVPETSRTTKKKPSLNFWKLQVSPESQHKSGVWISTDNGMNGDRDRRRPEHTGFSSRCSRRRYVLHLCVFVCERASVSACVCVSLCVYTFHQHSGDILQRGLLVLFPGCWKKAPFTSTSVSFDDLGCSGKSNHTQNQNLLLTLSRRQMSRVLTNAGRPTRV